MVALARFAVAGAMGLAFASLFAGCTKETTVKEVPGPTCKEQGGVEVEDAEGNKICEEKCDASKCPESNTCVSNRCALKCDLHSDCLDGSLGDPVTQRCENVANDVGEAVSVCVTTQLMPQIGMPCPIGDECGMIGDTACPDGSPCSAGGCPAEQCKPLICKTLGLEDGEAYCTTVDCQADTDCPGGYYCGITKIDNPICGNPDKGDQQLPCVDPANNAAVGGTYQEGPTSALQNACIKREPCAPCVEQRDCAIRSDMACVAIGPEAKMFCAETCLGIDDCPDDHTCVAASPPTPGFCVPKTQTCEPPATNNFCYNCLDDLDCGPAGPDNTVACIDLDAGQRGCFDISFSATCTVDGDCPKSPSGRSGECLDEGEGLAPGDSVYHRCYVPLISNGFQCWPE